MILSLFAYYLIGLPMYLLFGWFVYRRYHARQQCSKDLYLCRLPCSHSMGNVTQKPRAF